MPVQLHYKVGNTSPSFALELVADAVLARPFELLAEHPGLHGVFSRPLLDISTHSCERLPLWEVEQLLFDISLLRYAFLPQRTRIAHEYL